MFIVGILIGAIPVSSSPSPSDGWTLVAQRGVKAYPDLNETVWQKNASAPPHGPYDKIGLHRLVKTGIVPQGVVFILPGTWGSGEQMISNPPSDNWTAYENNSIALYLANRNFDVYSMDYRTHFVPTNLSASQLSFMANWGWTQWISDIKEAVDKAKEVSGAQKIYMGGQSFGGLAAMNYASVYWKDDLKGLIPFDAAGMGLPYGALGIKNPNPTNTYNLTAAIAKMNATGTWATAANSGALSEFKYADAHPGAPSPVPGYANITAYLANALYYAWGPGGVSNIYGGYGNARVMIHICATFDPYWPNRLGFETTAYTDWTNCPYVTYDFDDHYSNIDVPLLAFQSQYFGYPTYGPFQHGIANPDFTRILLKGYGHLDVFSGNYIEKDVNDPTYQWLMGARLLNVTSSPITGVTFAINGTSETTPYTAWLEGSYTLEMPETQNGWVWSRWLEDGDTNRIKTVTMNTSVTLTGVFERETYSIETATGTGTATFVTDVGILQNLTAVDEATLPTAGKPNLEFPQGFFSFKITGLTLGQTVTINITFPSNMPVDTQYWICQNGLWSQMPIVHNDTDKIITVTYTDGGLGDADGVKNGIIVDPGGVGIPKPLPPPPPPPLHPSVGGKAIPISQMISKPELQTAWIWLTTIILVIAVTGVFFKYRKKQ
jgi:pimeloyl-ACP methyl ester carboxylesterase